MLNKAFKLIAVSSFCAIAAALSLNPAGAKLDAISQVKSNNAEFSQILNAKLDPEVLLDFMHDKIADDAKITISVKDPKNKDAGEIEVKLTKTDYINSYLYGPRQVKDYRADIKTMDIEVDEKTNTLKAKEILTESGIMLNPFDYQDPGVPYTSYTSCEAEYKIESGEPTLQQTTCNTQIAYQESV
ncbi:MAG: hypothetical protein AB8B83_07860 [Bdellovibrionales bacterium]